MTAAEFKERFPHATADTLRLNGHLISDSPRRPAPSPVVECSVRHGPLAARKTERRNPDRFFVRVTSYRVRLLDEDNICEKYVVDCCRYSGLLPGDDPGQARIVPTQEKVGSKAEERTEIVIERIA